MTRDLYSGFADQYGRFFEQFDQHDPVYTAFFQRLFAERNVRSVLDCACGVGQDLHLFHSLGCTVCGSDASEAMLARAQMNLAAHHLDIPLVHADFRELPKYFSTQFDAVVCLSTSLLHILEITEIARALRSMYTVLRDGGILVLTQGLCDRQLRERPRFVPVINRADFSRVYVIDYLDTLMRVNILDLVHTEREQSMKTHIFEFRVIVYDDYERLLPQAGFRERKYYGSYRFDLYDKETSQRIIAVARRMGSE